MTFAPGDRIGDYEVLSSLGAGGMGSVYKVRHAISQRIEALKVILPNASESFEMEERFLREIRLLATLKHPHIAALHNAFRNHNELVMVMEYVEGVSLREKLHSPGITLAQALEYGTQVLDALVHAHAQGVIHRDIKPSNVMIGPNGWVKLLDFGLAASANPGGGLAAKDLELTEPGTMLGSPFYISPEQARGERADARSDLYSTGAMLYEMVSGRPPFAAGTGGAYAIIAAHLHETPQSPAQVNPRVSPELARIILKALAKSPSQRYASAAEFLAAVNAVQLDANSPEETATLAIESPRPYSPSDIERASKDLATFIGPIAHILARRAAADSPTLDDLYRTLAQEIGSAANRERFLGSMPRSSLNRSTAGTPSEG